MTTEHKPQNIRHALETLGAFGAREHHRKEGAAALATWDEYVLPIIEAVGRGELGPAHGVLARDLLAFSERLR